MSIAQIIKKILNGNNIKENKLIKKNTNLFLGVIIVGMKHITKAKIRSNILTSVNIRIPSL